jgi:hypothetical protein
VTVDILAAFDAKIAFHEGQIARLREARATAAGLLGLADSGPTPEVPPGKPEPRPRERSEPGARNAVPLVTRVARFLAEKGPHRVGGMVAAGVGSQPNINAELKTHSTWFRKTGPGLKDPWTVTEAGRAAATA